MRCDLPRHNGNYEEILLDVLSAEALQPLLLIGVQLLAFRSGSDMMQLCNLTQACSFCSQLPVFWKTVNLHVLQGAARSWTVCLAIITSSN